MGFVSKAMAQPPNDDCGGAIVFPTINTDGSCTSVSGNTQTATASPQAACSGTPSDDVWYSFTVPAGVSSLTYMMGADMSASSDDDLMIEIFDDCAGESLICEDPETGTLEGLVAGQTYLMRIYTYYEGEYASFQVCLIAGEPQAPANDNCDTATSVGTLPAFGDCVTITGLTMGATASAELGCNEWNEADDDLWYSITLPVGQNAIYFNTLSTLGEDDIMFELHDGCGGEAIHCSDPESGVFEGLTGGETYLLRVYTYYEDEFAQFEVCLSLPPNAAGNNDCSTAIAFSTLSEDECATVTINSLLATTSSEPSCNDGEAKDLWYSFHVPAGFSSIEFINTTISGDGDRMTEVWDACEGTVVACIDNEQGLITGLEGDHTYYLRSYMYYIEDAGEYTVCIKLGPNPPANDDCADAIAFPAIQENGDCSTVTGTTAGSSNTDEIEACWDTPDNDVWYSFTVPAGETALYYSFSYNDDDVSFSFQIFEDCETPSANHDCFDEANGVISDLESGATYLVRIFSTYDGMPLDFEMCLSTLPELLNDNVCDAVELDINSECEFEAYHNIGATGEAAHIEPDCGSYDENDVWFRVTVPANGAINIEVQDLGIYDAVMAAYTAASCEDELTEIDCNDDANDDVLMPGLSLEDLEPNTTIYIRVFGYGSDMGNFGICVTSPCTAPNNVTITPNGETITASWNEASTNATYSWEVRSSGLPGSGSTGLMASGTTAAGATSVTVNGLGFIQTYDFYLMTNCTEESSSEWSNATNFTTGVLAGCTDDEACNYNPDAMADDGSCTFVPTTWYQDADGDGYGNAEVTVEECGQPEGYVLNNTDCDDTDADHWTPSTVTVTVNIPNTICDDAAAITLAQGNPTGGTWTGTGVTNNMFTPSVAGAGNHTLTYTLDNLSSCVTGGSATATITVDDCTNIEDVASNQISIYPTQANDFVIIKGNDLKEASIMDLNGRLYKTVSLLNTSMVELNDLSQGLYLVRVTGNNTTAVFKIVKTNQ